jgi:DNA mismatch endonuclease (patch repair protein)
MVCQTENLPCSMDCFTDDQRRSLMARIRSQDTAPELTVRSVLHRAGYRFRIHRRDLPGCPDIVLPGRHLVLFVHGCFWHSHRRCKRASTPKSNRVYWVAKLEGNARRDRQQQLRLRRLGWRVAVIWECQTTDENQLRRRLEKLVHGCPQWREPSIGDVSNNAVSVRPDSATA